MHGKQNIESNMNAYELTTASIMVMAFVLVNQGRVAVLSETQTFPFVHIVSSSHHPAQGIM